MKKNSRRIFLKRSFLSLSSIAFISNPIFSLNSPIPPKKELNNKLALKSKAKSFFYAGMYASAEILYKELLRKYPNDISIYDGLGKVYSAQFKALDRVDICKIGYERNLLNHLFYDRYAQSLRCLSLGYPNKDKEYASQNNQINGLHQALLIYIKAIEIFPDKKYLREHLLDVEHSWQKQILRKTSNKSALLSIDQEFTDQIHSLSAPIKDTWMSTRSSGENKSRFANLKEANISIDKINGKMRRDLSQKRESLCREVNIKKEIKSHLLPFFEENIRINKIDKAVQIYERIKEIDPKESNCKGKLIQVYNKQRKIDSLINLYKTELVLKEDFWAFIGLGKSYIKKGDITKSKDNYLKAYTEYQKCRDKFNVKSDNLKITISYGIAKSLLMTGNEEECRIELLKTLSEIGTYRNGAILLCLYAESFIKSNKYMTESILQAYTGQLDLIKLGDDPIKLYVESYINRILLSERFQTVNTRSFSIPNSNKHILNATKPALYALARLYKSQRNIEAYNKTLDQIALVDGKSPLVKGRSIN